MTLRTFARSRARRPTIRRRPAHRADTGFRAVTRGPGVDDWAVVDPGGRVVYRGPMLDAAQLATALSRAA